MEIKNGRPGKLELNAKTMLLLTNQKTQQMHALAPSPEIVHVTSDGAYS
jgi:hypothetical protein